MLKIKMVYYMNEFLTEFKENIQLNEHNQLFFN